MKYYGELPKSLGIREIQLTEMMYYLYLPIKMKGKHNPKIEDRIMEPFGKLIGEINCDFIGEYGLDRYVNSYIYVSAKRLYQSPGHSFNRPGYHSDGFLSDDINYIWCNIDPTVFNTSKYALTEHHEYSLTEMDQQSLKENEYRFHPKELLRLDQYNIHRVADVEKPSVRTFFKLSFSLDRYNLEGNSRNFLFDYNWDYKEREEIRNHPVK